MEKKSQKLYLIAYNSLTAQNLWQAHYQILLIILLKEFIELNVNTKHDKKCETCGINYKEPDLPDNFKKYNTKTIPKNIILLKSKYDLKTRY